MEFPLRARIEDAVGLCEKTGKIHTVGFLNAVEAAQVAGFPCLKGAKTAFFGGYPGAERQLFFALPDWCDDPYQTAEIAALTFTYRPCDRLGHRDVLGSLMALGLTRESVGDILLEPGRAVVFLLPAVARFAAGQIGKIGRVGVRVIEGFSLPLPQHATLSEKSGTVASLRLDAVVSELIGNSRAAALALIADNAVIKNGLAVTKPTVTVAQGDEISVRKYGKFKIDECGDLSKKGRVILKYSKYT